jgi:uncharacterized membrane protein
VESRDRFGRTAGACEAEEEVVDKEDVFDKEEVHEEIVKEEMSRALRAAVVVLVVLGVVAAVGRTLFMSDLALRLEPLRDVTFARLGITDARLAERREAVASFDQRYASRPFLTLLHVVPGAAFLALAPLQFVARIRQRRLRFHRVLGRILVIIGLVSGVAALIFGLFIPFAGTIERIPIGLFGIIFLISMTKGYLAIRRGDQAAHREWMIRGFATALAISSVRVAASVLDPLMAPRGFDIRQILVTSFWVGWIVTLAAAETWIVATRPRRIASAATS